MHSLSNTFIGTRFTRWAIHGHRLDQSRLDRFYLSRKGHWIHSITQLEHIQSQTLSDRDLIVLTFQIVKLTLGLQRKKNTYFKASPETLKINGTLDLLKESWNNHPKDLDNHTLKFSQAWKWLRGTYKNIQLKAKSIEPSLSALQSRLLQLKMDILDKSVQHQNEEFQTVRDQIREAEMMEADKIHNLSRIKWLGSNDEPKNSSSPY